MPIYNPPIPICALSGETSSGKTLFPIMSTPNALDKSKPPQCVVHDLEGSAETYVSSLNFEWRDIRGMLADGLHMRKGTPKDSDPNWKKILLTNTEHANDHPAASMFRAVFMSVLSIEPGQFLTCSVDPFTALQVGAMEWLKLHPQAFYRTASQYIKAGSMFLVPDTRQMLEYFLTVDCRSRFEMTVITFHQKNEWVGTGDAARKSGERISEHWELVDKVASLSATLDRRPKAKGKSAPRVPSGCIVYPFGKSRMMVVKDGELLPALPPRIPEFTPDAIRAYFASPPDYDALKPSERMPGDDMSDDERLKVQAGIETDKRISEELKLSQMELQKSGMTAQAAAVAVQQAPLQQQPATQTTDVETPAMITQQQTATIMAMLPACFDSPAEFGEVLQRYGVGKLSELTESRAEDLHSELLRIDSERKMAKSAEKLAGTQPTAETVEATRVQAGTQGTPPIASVADVADKPVQPTTIDVNRVNALLALAHVAKIMPAVLADMMREIGGDGCVKLSQLTTAQADELSERLRAKNDSSQQGFTPPPATQSPDGMVTADQLGRIKKLVESTGLTYDEQVAWLERNSLKSFRNLQVNTADELISELLQVELGYKQKLGN